MIIAIMYGVNNGLCIDYLVGMYLVSVELGTGQIALHFKESKGIGPGSSFYIRGRFAIGHPGGCESAAFPDCSKGIAHLCQQLQGSQALTSLCRLLEKEVVSVQILGDENRVALTFTEGEILSVWDSNAPWYESFELRYGDSVYVV